MIEPITRLVTGISNGNREYVLLLGAGLSKDAGIKSGWDILLATLEPLYVTEINPEAKPTSAQIEKWYLNHTKFSKMDYSSILEAMHPGEIARREYLKKFFEDVQPGESHMLIAKLVAEKLVRYIFTTNFDDLLEKSLEELKIKYDVIFTDDQLSATKSWDKVDTCRIYKLHGDYKSGKIRNTKSELANLDPLIAEDFQYIIDRHGVVVIGYAGRDEGVMKHLIARNPFPYSIYWQYVSHPPNSEDFIHYYKLQNDYKQKQMEIQYIKNKSASNFVQSVLSGIDNLNRLLVVSQTDQFNYKDYIVNKDFKAIRSLSFELIDQFKKSFVEYYEKEKLDRHYSFHFANLSEFLPKSQFIFSYIDELIKYEEIGEMKFFLNKLFDMFNEYNQESYTFLTGTPPYYIIICCQAIFLINNNPNLIDIFSLMQMKFNNSHSTPLMDYVSHHEQGWAYINREHLKKNYYNVKFEVLIQNFLPSIITEKEFLNSDSYITLYALINKPDIDWISGAAVRFNGLGEMYSKYFEANMQNEESRKLLVDRLKQKLSGAGSIDYQGYQYLLSIIESSSRGDK